MIIDNFFFFKKGFNFKRTQIHGKGNFVPFEFYIYKINDECCRCRCNIRESNREKGEEFLTRVRIVQEKKRI